MSSRSLRVLGCVLAVAASTAASATAAGGAASPGFAFGRVGGNIRPYTVTISPAGAVSLSGPVTVGRRHLTSSQLRSLRRLAVQTQFATLPAAKRCTGTLPDVASTFIRVGSHTVRIHGSCVAAYNRLWLALGRAVGLSGMA